VAQACEEADQKTLRYAVSQSTAIIRVAVELTGVVAAASYARENAVAQLHIVR
jgi:hypothetical protein